MTEDHHRSSIITWWAVLAASTAAALLITWLARLAGVPLHILLYIVAGAIALAWLIVLVAAPWNLYFAARGVVAQMAGSERRGIVIAEADETEARRIARRMLWFALGGHAATALVTAVITYFSGGTLGYYFAGFYLLAATIRPAIAYFSHLRERISMLSRESLHPREDVITLRHDLEVLTGKVQLLALELPRAEANLTDGIAHARELLTDDLGRMRDAQAADREAARSRDADLTRQVGRMVRQIEDTLDGISDHQELQVGIRALIRMIKADSPG
jgi:hypothetical protein